MVGESSDLPAMTAAWPWLTLAGLGVFHGLNPAMGWLFAVALGLHRQSRRIVLVSLAPMALGHAASIALVAAAAATLGLIVDSAVLRIAAGLALLTWAAYHHLYGHRHRVRVGMTTGLAGLAVWSFLMASAHGAGLMLMPALLPLCAGSTAPDLGGAMLLPLAAVATHVAATLVVTGVIAYTVYSWVGLAGLRRNWINFDLVWTGMLVVAGVLLIIA